ncbi:MAG TPA: hypothetical protein VMV69_10135 [Pirellulales bacterium]|nr:hypothetical protein [Pirellulales bacterium]
MASVVELEQEVRELREKVETLAGGQAARDKTAVPIGPFTRHMIQLMQVTQDLFPGPVKVKLMCDPEVPSDPFVVFKVESKGEPKEIVDKQLEWHRRIRGILTDPHEELRLSIIPL